MPKKTPEELRLLKKFSEQNMTKEVKVSQMEELVQNFDIQKIIDLNKRLQAYYKKIGDEQALELLDRMTLAMDELSEIINQVKAKRLSLEQGQREIQEKLQEINQVLQMMQEWEATGL